MTNQQKDFLTKEIERVTPQLTRRLRRKLPSQDLVDEVLQEVFLDASRKVGMLMDHPNPDAWFMVAADLECLCMLAFLRQQGNTFTSLEDYQDFILSLERDDINLDRDTVILGRDTIDDLLPPDTPLRDRTVLKLYYELKMTSTEIGETIGVKPNNANQMLKRARTRLKKVLLQSVLTVLLSL